MKSLMPKKEATIQEIENYLVELQKLADILPEGSRWKSETECLIEDICHEEDICLFCFTKIDEAWTNDGLIKSCNCKSNKISA